MILVFGFWSLDFWNWDDLDFGILDLGFRAPTAWLSSAVALGVLRALTPPRGVEGEPRG